jgi:Na+/melibiose symporter-like transporter
MEMLLKVMTALVGISAVQLGVLFAIVVILGLKGR